MRNYFCSLFLAAALAPAIAFASSREPDVPPGVDPGGVAVAIIDSGVNYTLEVVASRLARNGKGEILGYDFHDNDRLPFDLVPGQRPDSGRHHGTRVACIFLREAPKARLVPYRYRAHSFSTFARIVETIAESPARIVIMALGGYRKKDWAYFNVAAKANPNLLFVISAGNDGRNIDENPVYPSGYRLANALVVASTDNFGRLPPASNWGTKTVDVSTPGEGIETVDHKGSKIFVSGSSFAVPRIAALAARFQAANPDWKAQDIKKAILALAGPSPGDSTPRTGYGWIANPALSGPRAE
ncbi:thermophilic serine proteinase precursor [bacterium BMS3Bbin10]|nr:thermophilic serine proteinase precursor [bacterium BMS3Bbin10]